MQKYQLQSVAISCHHFKAIITLSNPQAEYFDFLTEMSTETFHFQLFSFWDLFSETKLSSSTVHRELKPLISFYCPWNVAVAHSNGCQLVCSSESYSIKIWSRRWTTCKLLPTTFEQIMIIFHKTSTFEN